MFSPDGAVAGTVQHDGIVVEKILFHQRLSTVFPVAFCQPLDPELVVPVTGPFEPPVSDQQWLPPNSENACFATFLVSR